MPYKEKIGKGLAFNYNDSIEISPGLWYCIIKNLWWKDGIVYDELSAHHNGIIGQGAQLKDIIKNTKDAQCL